MSVRPSHATTGAGRPSPAGEPHSRQWRGLGIGFLIKLLLMGIVNALGVAVVLAAWASESWAILGAMVVIVVVVDWIYFSKRALPLKYLTPGLIFLAIFQLFTMAYTGYVAFTNYGTGHAGSQTQAVDALLIQNERRLETSPSFVLSIVRDGDELGFAIVVDGAVRVGSPESPLTEAPDAEVDQAGRVVSLPDWEVVSRAELLSDRGLQQAVVDLRVPVSDEPEDGSIRTREGSTGAIYRSVLEWDPDAQTMTNVDTGTVYSVTDRGRFEAPDGTQLPVGWYVTVGFENFTRAVTDSNYSTPLLRVAGWTFAFAILTVLSSFILGLILAIVYNDPRVRGRKFIRTLFILPYAFPAFMSGLLWRGMLNPEYGIINEFFFMDAYIPWLSDPWLAKFAILYVNLWLSYPYWFLVCTGALQALPTETMEAARIDGAGRWRTFRSVTMPLITVSTAPLAIASFAFNFNNFTLIYFLTEGRPRFTDTSAPLGHTDILISAIYQISGVAGGRADYGLASALSIIVFIVVGAISALAFRQTRKLEEMN
ncbi:MAG: maltose ABC transporter permease [Actinobacteria bacterium HGW-Actinobacteria-4]|nr:MAG: maltose ABC transporter permease [Actinobacteria bacterium HGW-Actinobacteria-4]